MIRNKYLLAALLAAAPLPGHAETNYIFDSISALKERLGTASITGILANDSTPTTVSFPANSDYYVERCDRLYTLMLSQPGMYTLTVTTDVVQVWYPDGPVAQTVFVGCSLDLKP